MMMLLSASRTLTITLTVDGSPVVTLDGERLVVILVATPLRTNGVVTVLA